LLASGNGGSNNAWAGMSVVQPTANSNNADLTFITRGSSIAERMRIDASGNVGIGRTPTVVESAYDSIQLGAGGMYLAGSSNLSAGQLGQNFYADASGNIKYLGNDEAERITFNNGIITFDNAPANTSGAGAALTFNERMRIDSSGNLLVGTTDSDPWTNSAGTSADTGIALREDGILGVSAYKSTTNVGNVSIFNRTNSNGGMIAFNRDGSAVGSISVTTSATAYNTSSDERLKENIADADDAGSKIDAIQVRKYDWKADGSHQDYGMIAQELQLVAPEAVSGDADSEEMMGVDYSKLVPMLIKEIQSLRNRVASLEE